MSPNPKARLKELLGSGDVMLCLDEIHENTVEQQFFQKVYANSEVFGIKSKLVTMTATPKGHTKCRRFHVETCGTSLFPEIGMTEFELLERDVARNI